MTIREQIIEANKAYRLGRPVMTDQAFDDLCEAYEKTVSPEEYAAFRDSLHEETGKVSHPFIMGSLVHHGLSRTGFANARHFCLRKRKRSASVSVSG